MQVLWLEKESLTVHDTSTVTQSGAFFGVKNIIKLFLPLVVTSIIAGLILSILGPFGTSRQSFVERLIYWVGLCVAGGLGAGLFDLLHMRFNWPAKSWLIVLGQSVGSTLLVTLALFAIFPPSTMPAIFVTFFYVWVIAILICGFGELLRKAKKASDTDIPFATRPAIIDRLPPKLRNADIYAISAEDHYVRVHTSLGDEMVLMRLSDAIKEVAPTLGERTHRSWWVAEAGIDKVVRKDGKTQLELKNNITAPVSRSGQKHIKEAGWV